MRLCRVRLSQFRCFEHIDWEPQPGLNVLLGANGMGKTSILESIHVMAYGRSFRGHGRDILVRKDQSECMIVLDWVETSQDSARQRRAGLRHAHQQWEAKLDGIAIQQLYTLFQACAVITFEPGSHALVTGSSQLRRRFLDWGLFHVKQSFMPLWRRYARGLKQRNLLLKQHLHSADLDAWDQEIALAGEQITAMRMEYLDRWQCRMVQVAQRIAPQLGLDAIVFNPGWRREESSLSDSLLRARERDCRLGYTTVGPHRADWSPVFTEIPGVVGLSRGQAKLTALSCLLAQSEDVRSEKGQWPVLVLDDLASELDGFHQNLLLAYLAEQSSQVLITATEVPLWDRQYMQQSTMFHVKHHGVESI